MKSFSFLFSFFCRERNEEASIQILSTLGRVSLFEIIIYTFRLPSCSSDAHFFVRDLKEK